MASMLHGVHVPHRKNTRKVAVLRMTPPQTVEIPMSMHIGRPATPIVKVGDTVKVGQKIGEADGYISSPIYASVSGKVKKITDFLLYNGTTTPAVVIESDGEMAVADTVAPPTVNSREELVAAIKDSGIVGLGGAGFPTYVKFDVNPARIDYLIINGAECEPYVTSDTITMVNRADDMAYALRALAQHMGIRQVIIGIENNKKTAIRTMRHMAAGISECSVQVRSLPSLYPQGGEKVLVYHTTGRVIPTGKLPIDMGCVVINCTTLATIGAYLQSGMPLVEKCVTVDGGCVKEPRNVIAPIGTAIRDLFQVCGGLKHEPAKYVYGGPMMGVTVPNDAAPVLKATNAVLALRAREAKLPKTTNCIRCGSCTNVCPFGLAPAAISHCVKLGEVDALEALHVDACMECGCCSFICPANRPLVQRNQLGKAMLKEKRAKEGAQ
ncbi:MAG: electron transport complex subunit RsxC [Clostridia bacterium]|nr:electron transport complex subunit RsxC [Clostridia bacterium]